PAERELGRALHRAGARARPVLGAGRRGRLRAQLERPHDRRDARRPAGADVLPDHHRPKDAPRAAAVDGHGCPLHARTVPGLQLGAPGEAPGLTRAGGRHIPVTFHGPCQPSQTGNATVTPTRPVLVSNTWEAAATWLNQANAAS